MAPESNQPGYIRYRENEGTSIYIYVIIGIYIIWVGLQSVLIFSLYSITLCVAVIEAIYWRAAQGACFFIYCRHKRYPAAAQKKKVFFFQYRFCFTTPEEWEEFQTIRLYVRKCSRIIQVLGGAIIIPSASVNICSCAHNSNWNMKRNSWTSRPKYNIWRWNRTRSNALLQDEREGGNIVKQKRDRDYRSQEEQCPPRHAIITQIYYLSTLLQYICQQTRLLRDPFPCILMFETQVFGQSVSVPSITSERHKNKKISAFVSTIY